MSERLNSFYCSGMRGGKGVIYIYVSRFSSTRIGLNDFEPALRHLDKILLDTIGTVLLCRTSAL